MANSFELEKEIQNKIRFGMNKDQIMRSLSSQIDDHQLLIEAVERVCDDYPDYKFIQFFMKAKIAVDKDGEDDKLYLYNPAHKVVKTINKTQLSSMIHPKLNWSHKRYTCNFVYDPLKYYKISEVEDEWRFNTYEPPKWQEDYFHSCGKKAVVGEKKLPKIYERFFKHLVDNSSESFHYLVDWLANMLQGRNYCILTTIGNQGIGKGLLGSIMKGLVGDSNYTQTGQRSLSKEFNGQIMNKRLVYLDEVKVSSIDQENTLKGLINDWIEIEQKGKDARLVRNYSSIYYSSNNLDSIRIPSDDRRFSIIELTDKKLITIMDKSEIDELLDEENINKLARYLFTKEYSSQRMLEVFRSSRIELLKSASLNRWQEWFVEEYAPEKVGKTIPVKQVSKDIEEGCDINHGPGRTKLMKFAEMYSDVFTVKNVRFNKEMKWCVIFKEGENGDL
jgi:hypothetical protein